MSPATYCTFYHGQPESFCEVLEVVSIATEIIPRLRRNDEIAGMGYSIFMHQLLLGKFLRPPRKKVPDTTRIAQLIGS